MRLINLKKGISGITIFLFGILLLGFNKEFDNINSSQQEDVNKWILDWQEDFTGNTLDTCIWNYMDRRRQGSWKYHSSHPQNYKLHNGILTLKGFRNNGSIQDTALYLTGGIYTKGKKSFAPGKFEIRAKLKNAYGGTSAIWLMPFKTEKGWPADGEIDIMEHAKHNSKVSQTVHTDFTKAKTSSLPKRTAWINVNSEEYNTYGIEIFRDSLVFYVNQMKTLVYPKIDSLSDYGQFPFYKDWYLLLNVNLNISDNDSIAQLELPVEMNVDWVKHYRLK